MTENNNRERKTETKGAIESVWQPLFDAGLQPCVKNFMECGGLAAAFAIESAPQN
jgi:hypothetical protein